MKCLRATPTAWLLVGLLLFPFELQRARAGVDDVEVTTTLDALPITRRVPGDTIAYRAEVRNGGAESVTINWTDPLPPGLSYAPGSLLATAGAADDSNPANLRWSGTLDPGAEVGIEFSAVVDGSTPCPTVIDNRAFARLPSELGVQADARVEVLCIRIDSSACAGDCGRDDVVTVDELVVGANNRLAVPAVGQCAAVDTDGSATVSIAELRAGVEIALGACPLSFGGLAGSWTGPLFRLGSPLAFGGQQTLTLHADGTVDGIVGSQTAQLSVLDRPHRIFGFRRGDGVTGALQFSADGLHAVFIDEFFVAGALEKGATALAPSYSRIDLDFDYALGSIARYGPSDRAAGENTEFTVDAVFPFSGIVVDTGHFGLVSSGPRFLSDPAHPLDLSPDQDLAAIGLFEGEWQTLGGGASGAAAFLITPDKNFLAALTCTGPFPQCDFSDWSRLFGPFLETCVQCTLDNASPTLHCRCTRADGRTISTSSLTLPCLGSIANADGILICS